MIGSWRGTLRAAIARGVFACALCALAACLPRPPHMMAPYYRVGPGESDAIGGGAWLVDPRVGDRYAVAGEDLVFRESAAIGPADDRTGRCSVDGDGKVSFVAPKTPGEWPCLLRACRETCWVSRVTLVVDPKVDAGHPH